MKVQFYLKEIRYSPLRRFWLWAEIQGERRKIAGLFDEEISTSVLSAIEQAFELGAEMAINDLSGRLRDSQPRAEGQLGVWVRK